MTSLKDVKDDIKTGFAAYGGRSLTKLAFIALSAMMKARLPCHTWSMTPWQNWVRSISYRGLNDQTLLAAKLLLHIHSYLLDMDVDLVDASVIGPESSQNQCNTALRRQLNALQDGNTQSRRKVEPPPEPDFHDIIIDANNRFSVLFEEHGASEDHTFYNDDDVIMVPLNEPSLEQKRYRTQAESNVTRVKMGYPPKGTASVNSREYAEIKEKSKTLDATRVLINRVYRPLFRWRRDYLIPYREGKIAKEEITIVPLTLLGVYEQCFQAYNEPGCRLPTPRKGGLDGVPRVWDDFPEQKVTTSQYRVVEELAKQATGA